jgi:hypothetical protein
MALELDGSYAKLDWAEQHLDELQGKLGTGVGKEPYRVRSEFYPEADVLVGRLIIPTPPLWGVMTGNIIHNARSALDYMVRQLVRQAGNVPKDGPGGNQFPIFDMRPDAGFTKRVRNSMLAGVEDSDRAAIKRLQPYVTANYPDLPPNPLSDLAALSNVDKHQRLVSSVLNPRAGHRVSGKLRFSQGVQEVVDHHFAALTTLKDGAVFAWAEIVRNGATEPKMYVDANMTLQVGLEDGRNLGVTLAVLLNSTRMILDAFASGAPEWLSLRRENPPTVVLF